VAVAVALTSVKDKVFFSFQTINRLSTEPYLRKIFSKKNIYFMFSIWFSESLLPRGRYHRALTEYTDQISDVKLYVCVFIFI